MVLLASPLEYAPAHSVQCAGYIATLASSARLAASTSANIIARARDFDSIACWVANRAWPALKPVWSFHMLIIGPTSFKVSPEFPYVNNRTDQL